MVCRSEALGTHHRSGPSKVMAGPGYSEMHMSLGEADVSPLFQNPDSCDERTVWDSAMIHWLH